MLDSIQMINIIEKTFNKMNPRLVNHVHRVSFIMMKTLQYSKQYSDAFVRDITMVTLLHDIGTFKTEDIDQILDITNTGIKDHCIYGYLFCKYLSPLAKYADIIMYHHTSLAKLLKLDIEYKEIVQLLHIIDQVDVYWQIHGEYAFMLEWLKTYQGVNYSKQAIQLFLEAMEASKVLETIYIQKQLPVLDIFISKPYLQLELLELLRMIAFSMDFRSEFTMIHTITTTSIACKLADLLQIDKEVQLKIYYGALLHDIGKVATPVDILENPGRLTKEEMDIMKLHVSHTIDILDACLDEEIAKIACRHHEKLDGSGYPLGLSANELTIPQRVVAVADIFSALYGQRSYKQGYDKEKIIEIMTRMATNGEIDYEIVKMATLHYDEIIETVKVQCEPILKVYTCLFDEYEQMKKELQGKNVS